MPSKNEERVSEIKQLNINLRIKIMHFKGRKRYVLSAKFISGITNFFLKRIQNLMILFLTF